MADAAGGALDDSGPDEAAADGAVPDNAVFVSYSREDEVFARDLAEGLSARGLPTWFDRDDIPPAADWMKEITEGLAAAEGLVVVVSPDWMSSEVCGVELDSALALGKRVVPVLHRPGDAMRPERAMRPELAKLNWVEWGPDDDASAALDQIEEAFRADPDWTREHTRLLQQALRWEQGGGDKSLLLGRTDLADAEAALDVTRDDGLPQVTDLQRRFVHASRVAATRRLRRLVTITIVVAVVSIGLAVAAFLARQEADRQRAAAEERERIATSRALAAQSLAIKDAEEEEAALLLAVDAVALTAGEPTSESLDALLQALQVVDGDQSFRSEEMEELFETVDRLNRELGIVSLSEDGTELRVDATGEIHQLFDEPGQQLDGDRDLTISHDDRQVMWDIRDADGIASFGRIDVAGGERLPDIAPGGVGYGAAFTDSGEIVTLSSPSGDPSVDLVLAVWDGDSATEKFAAPIAFRFSDEQSFDLENVLLTFSPSQPLGAIVNLFGQPQLMSPLDLKFVGTLLDVDCSEEFDDDQVDVFDDEFDDEADSLGDEFGVSRCRSETALDGALDDSADEDDFFEAAESGTEILAGFDDDVLTTIDFGNLERSWSLDPDEWVERACEIAGRNLTRSEWTRFRGADTPYAATCAEFPDGDA